MRFFSAEFALAFFVGVFIIGTASVDAAPRSTSCPTTPPTFSGYYGRCSKITKSGFGGFVAQCFCDGTCAEANSPGCVSVIQKSGEIEKNQVSSRATGAQYGRVTGMWGRPGKIPVNEAGQYDPRGESFVTDRMNYGPCRSTSKQFVLNPKKKSNGGICVSRNRRSQKLEQPQVESVTYVPFPG